MRKAIRIIKASEMKENFSMQKAIDAMGWAFSSLAAGDCYVPLRYVSKLPSNGNMMIFKPAYVEKDKQVSVKILTQRESGPMQGIPRIQGLVLVMDAESGEILSMMDGEYITTLRTGAASGLATRCLARKDAHTLALFGCGTQGRSQVEAVLCERDIKKVFAFDKQKSVAERFIHEMQDRFQVDMVFSNDLSDLKEADIICTATNSTGPLFLKEDVKRGVHINAIGSFQPDMQELDPYLLRDARVFVDQAASCLKESGDLIKPILDGIISEDDIAGEIGDFVLQKIRGRESEDETTVFKSVGVAIQDYAVASEIYKISQEEGFGVDIKLFD